MYYSGHGVIYNNQTQGQAGTFEVSDYIPIEDNTYKLGARANTFVLTIFDGCREGVASKSSAVDSRDLTSTHGQYWLSFATKAGQTAISNPPLSDFTKKLTDHFNKVGSGIIFPNHLINFPYVHGEN